MSVSTPDSVFQICRVTSFLQHILIIIGFQECGMALFEIMNQPLTGCTNIRENTDIGFGCTHDKTMWVTGIMFLLKGCYAKASYLYWLLLSKMMCKFSDFPETCFFHG